NHFDTESQINNGVQIAEELDAKGDAIIREELAVVVRYLHPEQVIELCDRVGLSVIEMWGDFEGTPISEESDEIVVLARHSESVEEISVD
ncbi:MAG: hypothetical protein ACPHK0_06770, partial [Dehalococcoidia bacterium]